MTDFNIPASLLDENLPHSIRQMDLAEKERLARDIRQTIIQVVAKKRRTFGTLPRSCGTDACASFRFQSFPRPHHLGRRASMLSMETAHKKSERF